MLPRSMATETHSCLRPRCSLLAFSYGTSCILGKCFVDLADTGTSSLSHKLWHVALSRVIVGAGSAGIELLTVVVINGTLCHSAHGRRL